MTTNLIYGLVDPRTHLVRYIGLTANGMRRPRDHRHPTLLKEHSHKSAWIKSLHAAGLDYTIVVLEEDPPDLAEAERFWIAYGRACGWPLTNHTEGGDRPRITDVMRKKISAAQTGKTATPETRARMRAAATGKHKTPEHAARIAAALRGRPKSEEHRARIAEAMRGRTAGPMSDEHRAKIAAGQKRRWQRQKEQSAR